MSTFLHRRSAESARRRSVAAQRSRAAGFTLVELILALALLVVFFAVFTPLLLAVAQERRFSAQQQAALQHAGNVLERATALPWDALSTAAAADWPLPQSVRDVLPNAEQEIRVTVDPDDPAAKRVQVTVRWQSRQAGGQSRLSLEAWAFSGEQGGE